MYSSVLHQNPKSGNAIIVTSPSGGRPKPTNKPTVFRSFVAGASSGAVTCVLFQPFDLVKTRLQVPSSLLLTLNVENSGGAAIANGLVRKNYILNTVSRVIQQESYSGLWRGLTPSLYRTVPGIGMYFCTLHWMKTSFINDPSFYENMALGFAARAVVGTVMLPITVIKTRYESGCFNYKTVPQALKNIWKVEGTKGLFSGWTATIARDAPYSGIYYMFYSQQKNMFIQAYGRNLNAKEHFQCGLIAGLLACIVTQPMDVVKTQMQLNSTRYKGTVHCTATILKESGLAGFTRGILPRLLRKSLISALSWTLFEEIMKLNIKVK